MNAMLPFLFLSFFLLLGSELSTLLSLAFLLHSEHETNHMSVNVLLFCKYEKPI